MYPVCVENLACTFSCDTENISGCVTCHALFLKCHECTSINMCMCSVMQGLGTCNVRRLRESEVDGSLLQEH